MKGRYRAEIKLSDLDPPRAVTLAGSAEGALGFGSGEGRITLVGRRAAAPTSATIMRRRSAARWRAIGGRLLDGAARVIIGQFFAALAREAGGTATQSRSVSCLRSSRRVFGGQRMKPAAFDYVRAEHLDEALGVLDREGGDARVLAGGQSLMPMLNMRLAKPPTLIDIMRLAELARIERRAGYDRDRRWGAPGGVAGMARPWPRPAAARAGVAVDRSRPDA